MRSVGAFFVRVRERLGGGRAKIRLGQDKGSGGKIVRENFVPPFDSDSTLLNAVNSVQ